MRDRPKLLLLGAGNRGRVYAASAARHGAEITAIAEPREDARAQLALQCGVAEDAVFTDWRDLLRAASSASLTADAVVIATPDREHVAPAVAFAERGYHLLLEKPMAPTEAECRAVVQAVARAGVMMAVGHVLRYTPYTQTLKKLLGEGAVGEVISVQHLEPVGYWHHAHSYVRGNWRNVATSSPMLLAKSCHDLDWLRYIIGEPCKTVSSFGSLTHFRRENKPAAAGRATRCLSCDFEPQCPYAATRFYLDLAARGETGMPLSAVTLDTSVEGVAEALETGPYGRCVYECDNDVVDHQVVNLEFISGKTASFTMTAFAVPRPRETRIFGTHGELSGDGRTITMTDFLTERVRTVDTSEGVSSALLEGHGGGDDALMAAFVRALRSGDSSELLSGPEEALESHLMVFAAERSRLEGRTVTL